MNPASTVGATYLLLQRRGLAVGLHKIEQSGASGIVLVHWLKGQMVGGAASVEDHCCDPAIVSHHKAIVCATWQQ